MQNVTLPAKIVSHFVIKPKVKFNFCEAMLFLCNYLVCLSKIYNHMRNVPKKAANLLVGCLCAFLEWTWRWFSSGFSWEVQNSWEMMSRHFANAETSDIYYICFCHVNKRLAAKGYGRRFSNCRHPGRAVYSIIHQWLWGSVVYIKSTREHGVQDQEKVVRRVQLNTRTW
jgi:hypothetical protein